MTTRFFDDDAATLNILRGQRASLDSLYAEEGTYRKMLKEPRPEDVRRNLRKDTPLLLVLLARRVVVFLARALATTDTRVTRVTCNSKKRAKVITCRLGNRYEFTAIPEISFYIEILLN